MDGQEYDARMQELLAEIPEEFRTFVSAQAYDRGHSAGYEEVLGIAQGIVFELVPSISKYTKRLGTSG